jgi:small subunit ribosomal protein S8
MSMTDPIADFLTRVRNGGHAQKEKVSAPHSGLKLEIARILKEQGYIESYAIEPRPDGGTGEVITVHIRYTEQRRPVISGIARHSRPGRRVYVGHGDIPKIQGGMGTAIVSTSHGVMTGHEARRAGIGGEVVATVW